MMENLARSKNKVEDNIDYELDNEKGTLNNILRELFGY